MKFDVPAEGSKEEAADVPSRNDYIPLSTSDPQFPDPECLTKLDEIIVPGGVSAIGSGSFWENLANMQFDTVAGIVLVLNGLWVGVNVDMVARYQSTTMPAGFVVVDIFFCIFFVAEF